MSDDFDVTSRDINKTSFKKKVKFGKNVSIIEPVNLYECSIGDNCFIAHGVMFTNDKFTEEKGSYIKELLDTSMSILGVSIKY